MRFYIINLLFLVSFLWGSTVMAQVPNDECQGAIKLTQLDNWCSGFTSFSNNGATDSEILNNSCFSTDVNDVWFSFIPEKFDIKITIKGRSFNGSTEGKIGNPEIALFYGNCDGLTQYVCNVAGDDHFTELYKGGLIPGLTHYIRVSSIEANEGRFNLCINNYNAPAMPGGDCISASYLCDKTSFDVPLISGVGLHRNEISDNTCLGTGIEGSPESNSTWYKWICDKSGTLTFTITPTELDDDIDFILFEMTNGIDECGEKDILRCMAAGTGNCKPVLGPTGLKFSANDTEETAGCGNNQDGWLAPINMVSGKAYLLMINNFSNFGHGIGIEFGGTGTFLGPKFDLEFIPDTMRCLDTVSILNHSSFDNGTIVDYQWRFGEDSDPENGTGVENKKVYYDSFGEKYITLSLKTDRGCIVSETFKYWVDSCCTTANDDLILGNIQLQDPECNGYNTGRISYEGQQGAPWYKYHLNDDKATYKHNYYGLPAGDYKLTVFDRFGCSRQEDVTLGQPDTFIVVANDDYTIELGDKGNIFANVVPDTNDVDYIWSPDVKIDCIDCKSTDVLPLGKTTYVVRVENENGCWAIDSVTIDVRVDRKILAPNVFSPNFDGINDNFTLFGNKAVEKILELNIYDRWGGLVWQGTDIPATGASGLGWDGLVNGQHDIDQGVYAWMAKVLFIDGVDIVFSGDITLIK